MIVTFDDPKNPDVQREYKFDMDDIDVVQSRYIKRMAHLNPKTLFDGLKEGDPDALVAIYWLMLAQNGIATDIGKLNFKLAKFGQALNDAAESEYSAQLGITVEELRELAERAVKEDTTVEELLGERPNPTMPAETSA